MLNQQLAIATALTENLKRDSPQLISHAVAPKV